MFSDPFVRSNFVRRTSGHWASLGQATAGVGLGSPSSSLYSPMYDVDGFWRVASDHTVLQCYAYFETI